MESVCLIRATLFSHYGALRNYLNWVPATQRKVHRQKPRQIGASGCLTALYSIAMSGMRQNSDGCMDNSRPWPSVGFLEIVRTGVSSVLGTERNAQSFEARANALRVFTAVARRAVGGAVQPRSRPCRFGFRFRRPARAKTACRLMYRRLR